MTKNDIGQTPWFKPVDNETKDISILTHNGPSVLLERALTGIRVYLSRGDHWGYIGHIESRWTEGKWAAIPKGSLIRHDFATMQEAAIYILEVSTNE